MKVESLRVGPIQTNCYILCDETAKVCAVIDPGDEGDRIAAAVEKTGCALQYVLLTHGHFDHFTGLAALLRHYDVPVYIQPKDAMEQDDGNQYSVRFPRLDDAHQRWYGDGDELQLGNLTIRVMETPGHSQGSVCLVVGDVIFSGDTLFRSSCGRTDLPGGDYRAILESLGRLGRLEGDYHVYPGHDRDSTLAEERRFNPYLRHGMGLE